MKRITAQKNLFIWILLAVLAGNNLTRAAAQTITSFSPLKGAVATEVTILGTGFSDVPKQP